MQDNVQVSFESTVLCGDVLYRDKTLPLTTLFLHGAGQAERGRFLPLREALLVQYGIPSCAVDFIGQGETGGDLLSSSLKHRSEQAIAVIEQQALTQPLNIIAASMSAYIAVKLTQHYKVNSLTLMVPAIYDVAAYRVPFGEAFSTLLRRSKSWEDSDAWNILNHFLGNITVVSAAFDTVIPAEIIEKLRQCTSRAKQKNYIEIAESSHQLLTFINQNPKELQKLTDIISSVIKK